MKKHVSKVSPPPPVNTIPLPGTNLGQGSAQPKAPIAHAAKVRTTPQARRLAASTSYAAQLHRQMAGYPRRTKTGKISLLFRTLLAIALTMAFLGFLLYRS